MAGHCPVGDLRWALAVPTPPGRNRSTATHDHVRVLLLENPRDQRRGPSLIHPLLNPVAQTEAVHQPERFGTAAAFMSGAMRDRSPAVAIRSAIAGDLPAHHRLVTTNQRTDLAVGQPLLQSSGDYRPILTGQRPR